ncbi:MAG: ankyrin repeat domain-containing protein [Acidobacteria bacterium]|nr:ankyrin repeat domain-containing protein [Acidobacteriota bacterium]
MLKAGAKVDAGLDDGRTPLMLAVTIGVPGIVKLLIDAGANLNLRDQHGKTALQWAMESDNNNMIELLKKAGAKE